MNFKVAIIFTVLLSLLAAAQVNGQCTATIRLGGFVYDAPHIIALANGYYNVSGLCVQFLQVPGSVGQFVNFAAGQYDIIATALDNVANRLINSGIQGYSIVSAIGKGTDFVIVGNTALGINSITDLSNKNIAVDSPTSGFVLVMNQILAQNGVTGYTLVAVGGALQRYQVITAGYSGSTVVHGTNLVAPYTAMLNSTFKVLARISDYVVPFQNDLMAVNTSATNNQQNIQNFIMGYVLGTRALYAARAAGSGSFYDKIVGQLATAFGVSTAVGVQQLLADTDPKSGLNVDCMLSIPGSYNTLQVRANATGGFTNPYNFTQMLTPTVGGFYDPYTYLAPAIAKANTININPTPSPTPAGVNSASVIGPMSAMVVLAIAFLFCL